jgi:hypothetical protein
MTWHKITRMPLFLFFSEAPSASHDDLPGLAYETDGEPYFPLCCLAINPLVIVFSRTKDTQKPDTDVESI